MMVEKAVRREQITEDKIQSSAFVILAVGGFLLASGFVFFNRLESDVSSEIRLDCKINPNIATVESMARLEGIGLVRASAIVKYRQKYCEEDSNCVAFKDCSDLRKVKGIGPKTVENISKWLKFE